MSKVRGWDWCVAMVVALFFPYAYVVVAELWYYSVFVGTRRTAREHYEASRGRYVGVSVAVVVLSLVYVVAQRLYGTGVLSAVSPQVYAVSRSVLLFVCILMAVWQIVILLNAYSYAVDGDNFKNSRARYLLLFVLAPIGAVVIGRAGGKE